MDNFPQASPQGNSSQILVKPEIALARIRDGGAYGLSCPIKNLYFTFTCGHKAWNIGFYTLKLLLVSSIESTLFINYCIF